MKRRSWVRGARWMICALVVLLLAGIGADRAEAQQVNTGKISFSAGIDFTNAYLFRGIAQETEGFIAQPYADLTANLYDRPDANGLTAVNLTIGGWNSLHSGPTGRDGPSSNVQAWYESDFFTGFSLTIDNWEASAIYTSYMSPNDSFGSVQELALGLTMDDSALLGTFSLSPHVLLAIELSGQADGGDSEGVYLELGVEPGLDVLNDVATLSFPVTFGLSLSNYYENGMPAAAPPALPEVPTFNDRFGFFSIGAAVGVPLPMMGEAFGSWELSGSFHLYSLGDYLKFLNSDNGTQAVGAFGVSIGY